MYDDSATPDGRPAGPHGAADDSAEARAALLAVIGAHVARTFRDGRRDSLGSDTPLISSGIVDSAGVLHLVDWLEARFTIQLADEDVTPENFETLATLAELVEQHGGRS